MRALSGFLLLLLWFPTSCGSSDDTSSGDPLGPGTPDAATSPRVDAAPGQADASAGAADADGAAPLADEIEGLVVGDYVLRLRVATIQQAPFIGEIHTVTTSTGVATIERSGDEFVLTEQGCHVDSDSGDAVSTEIPDDIPRSTAPAVATLGFWKEGAELRWSRPRVTTLVGVDLDDPENDALPTEATDAHVVDQDDDGNPGVTVHVSGLASGAVYVVQRTRVAYGGGVLSSDGRLVGLADDDSEQSVIGADNPLLDQNLATEPNPDPSLSTVTMVPVGEPYACDRAVAEADSLFP